MACSASQALPVVRSPPCIAKACRSRSSLRRRRSTPSASRCPRPARTSHVRVSARRSRTRSRAARSTTSRSSRISPRSRSWASACTGRPVWPRACSPPSRTVASTSWRSRRDRRSSTSPPWFRRQICRPQCAAFTASSSSVDLGGGAAVRPEHADVVLFGFGQIGRTLARQCSGRARQDGPRARVVGVIDRSGYVFDPNGISTRRLASLANEKARGRRLSSTNGGAAASTSGRARDDRSSCVVAPDLRRSHRRRHQRPAAKRARRRDGCGSREQAASLRQARRCRGTPANRADARSTHSSRDDRRRRPSDHRHLLQARRGARSRAPHRRLHVRHARVPPERDRTRPTLLRVAAQGDGERLHGAGPARRSLRNGRRSQGAHPRATARVRGRARGHCARVARCRERARKLPLAAFLARLEEFDGAWDARARDARRTGACCVMLRRSRGVASRSDCRPSSRRARSRRSTEPTTRSRSRRCAIRRTR